MSDRVAVGLGRIGWEAALGLRRQAVPQPIRPHPLGNDSVWGNGTRGGDSDGTFGRVHALEFFGLWASGEVGPVRTVEQSAPRRDSPCLWSIGDREKDRAP